MTEIARPATAMLTCLLGLFLFGAESALPALAQADLPTPESVLGHKPGDDFYLASYDEALDYMHKLDQASDRLQMVSVGKTSLGLDWYMAFISTPQNLAQLERYKEISRRLARAQGVSEPEARRLASEGRVIVHIDSGLHSTEVAHAQHAIQLAYDLASSRDPQVEQILGNVILALWFSINPDGQNMVVSWYRRNLGTPYEVSSLPWLYQKYVGHDNNRDGYMNNMLESQLVTQQLLDYSPQVFYNHHQTAPFPARIWIPPFAEPVSSNVHPLMWRWVNLFGTAMAAYLDERGMPGSIHRGRGFDDWYPGFIDHVNSFRNTVSFLTETALYRYATPHFYTVNDFPPNRRDLRSEVLYASPWKGGWWRLADAVRYMLGASMSVLDTASKYRQNLLFNRYQAGRDTIQRFRREPPYAYVIPPDQRDPQSAALLAEKMRLNGIDVHSTAEAFTANGRRFPPGSWVILMDQAFAALVKEVFEVQSYPDLRDFPQGPPDLPYDVAGWTLPLQMGVDVTAVSTALDEGFLSRLQRLDEVVPPPGAVQGNGTVFTFSHSSNSAIKAVNQVLAAGGQVVVDQSIKAVRPGAQPEYGAFSASGLSRSEMEGIAARHSLQVQAGSQQPSKPLSLRLPRLGLYRPWVASIDEGWTRWLLEQYGFNPESIYNADFQAGRLGDRFDVLLIADTRPQSILDGHAAGTIPAEFSGGMGEKGLQNLIQFVKQGGTLITFNNASLFAIEQFNLPVENVLKGLKNEEFFCSGSLLKVGLPADSDHPVVMGMPPEPAVMFQRGPAFKAKAGLQGRGALASYPKERNPLLSGYILHPEKIQGAAALMEVAYGKGRLILFGFRPQWRGQSHGTYMLIFNALYYFGEAAQTAPPIAGSARGLELNLWTDLKDSIEQDFKGLIGANRAFHQARGMRAVEERKQLDALIERFQKERFKELQELREALQPPLPDKVSEYISKLKNLLVDIRGKDLTGVDYSPQDLADHYGLQPLEKEITSALKGR